MPYQPPPPYSAMDPAYTSRPPPVAPSPPVENVESVPPPYVSGAEVPVHPDPAKAGLIPPAGDPAKLPLLAGDVTAPPLMSTPGMLMMPSPGPAATTSSPANVYPITGQFNCQN